MRVEHPTVITTGDEESFAAVMLGMGAKTTLYRMARARARRFFDDLAQVVKDHLAGGGDRAAKVAAVLDALLLPSTPGAWEWATTTLQADLLATFGATLGAAFLPLAACFCDQAAILGAEFATRASQNVLRARVLADELAGYEILAEVAERVLAALEE